MKHARNAEEIEQVREKILEGALDIIVKNGYDALTMRLLASRIGMTAPNIYNYYSGKEALYFSIVIRGFEKLFKNLEKAYKSVDDKFARARALFEAYIEFGITNQRYYDVMFNRFTPYYGGNQRRSHQGLAESERRISMNIVNLTQKSISEMLGTDIDDMTMQMRVIQIWSALHGMVSLYNSRVVSYVAKDSKNVYSKIIDEFIFSLKIFSPSNND